MVSRSTLSEANESVVDNGDGTYSRVIVGGTSASPSVVQGNVANNAAEAGNPVLMAGTYDASPTSRTSGNRSRLQTGLTGSLNVSLRQSDGNNGVRYQTIGQDADTNVLAALVMQSDGMLFNGTTWDRARGDTVGQSVIQGLTGSWWNYAAAAGGILNTTTAVTVKAAAGASVRNYIRQLELEWETLGAATEFAIRDGAAGTVLYRTKLGTVAGRKVIPLQLRGTANTLLEIVTLTASVTGAVYANLDGYTGA